MSIDRKKFHKLVDGMLDLLEGGDASEDEDEEEEEVKPSRRSKKKSKKKTSKKKSRRKAKEVDEDEEEDEDEGEETVSLNQVRKAMRAYSAEYGKDAAKELLEEYGVKTLSSLEEEDYGSLLQDINDASEED